MRECNSEDIFCKAFYRQNEESFLEGQASCFKHFGGVPRKVIFDNAKVAVKEGFGVHAKMQDKYAAFAAHYAFEAVFCNVAQGHEKGLVEGLVGWSRRNILVPVPRVNNLDELNDELLKRCIKYREHQIKGKPNTVGEAAKAYATKMIKLPQYTFDTSKTIIARVDDFSCVKFDYNKYSVPFRYAGKEVCVKGYGNEVTVMYQHNSIANYQRCYERDKTNYRLEHYIDLIERRPRSLFNAAPIKATVPERVIEIGKRLSSPKEVVKLLRLYINFGDNLIKELDKITSTDISIEQIEAKLIKVDTIVHVSSEADVKVEQPTLKKYDSLLKEGVAI